MTALLTLLMVNTIWRRFRAPGDGDGGLVSSVVGALHSANLNWLDLLGAYTTMTRSWILLRFMARLVHVFLTLV